ncbi:SIS domain-containing protein [Paenibacillus sp. P26]|nr:SIS domain-containing protein [Paenibacillus sp. P26]
MTSFTAFYMNELTKALAKLDNSLAGDIVMTLAEAWQAGKKIFILGNGGSASTSSHFACDLSKMTIVPGLPRFKVIALTDNIPVMTAWANDTDYSEIFAQQLIPLAEPGDIVIGITGSGNSKNVLKAFEAAQAAGALTISLTGFQGGKVKALSNKCLIVPSDNMQVIEDAHSILTHAFSLQLRAMIMNYLPDKRLKPVGEMELSKIY